MSKNPVHIVQGFKRLLKRSSITTYQPMPFPVYRDVSFSCDI